MKTVVRHMFVWVVIYIVYTIMLSMNNDPVAMMLFNLVNITLYMLAYYLLRNVQLPYLYDRNKKTLFILSLVLSSIGLYLMYRLGLSFLDGIRGLTSKLYYDLMADFLVKVIRFYSPAIALLALESHFKGKKEQAQIRKLENENLANELKFLKAQINPHFLFNTLNSLYSYVLIDSPKAPDMILKLSAILDYALYKSQQKYVLLSEEIETIKNYLNLEQIRFGERLEIDFKLDGDFSVYISPLILLSMVESAFKNGIKDEVDVSKIYIQIYENEKRVYCEVSNAKSSINAVEKREINAEIDLSNIKRQLDLVYPDRHTLKIKGNNNTFNFHLIINTEV